MLPDRINQTITLEDGRRLGFAEFGNPTGIPVFHFHGAGSSRLERPALEGMLIQMGIHFITVDRPGHGLSDFQPNRHLIDWPRDVRQLADHLGIHKFYVEGYSAGGPHALACAHQLPGRVIAGAAVSSVAPMSRPNAYEGMPILNQLLARSSRHIPWLTKLIRKVMRVMVMSDLDKATRQLMSSIPEADKSVLYASQNFDLFVSSIREGFRRGSQGVAQDDVVCNREWGFSLKDVQPRIDIWHGEVDVNVPVHASRYLEAILPNRRSICLPGEGHFMIFQHWEEILSVLANRNWVDILRDWE